jgi:uncharacterized integral membrane protein
MRQKLRISRRFHEEIETALKLRATPPNSGRPSTIPAWTRPSEGRDMSFNLMLVLGLLGIALIFIVQNVAAVDVNFLLWTVSMSRALLIIFTLVIGFLLGWFLHSFYTYRRSKPATPTKERN